MSLFCCGIRGFSSSSYLIDTYCKIETEWLQFLWREQTALRADCYQDLWDAILDGDGDPNNIGHRIILPSAFIGGPCYMHERQQDAMSYVRKYRHRPCWVISVAKTADGQMAFQLHIVDYDSELKIVISFQLWHTATEVGADITNINVIYKLIATSIGLLH